MIQHTFSAEGFEKTDKLQKYVEKKVKDIEKYIPRKARSSAQLTVRVTKTPRTKAEMYGCSVSLTLPEQTLNAGEKVEHAYAALDVTMAELKRQVAEYKDKHGRETFRARATRRLGKLRGGNANEEQLFAEMLAAQEAAKAKSRSTKK